MGCFGVAVKKPPVPPAPSNYTFLLHASGSSTGAGVLLEVPASQVTFADQGLSYIYRSAMISDGRVVFPCYDGDGRVLVKCYEAGSLTSESWATYITGSEVAYQMDITILTGGNIVVAWSDYSTERVEFAILNSSGGIVQGMTNGIGTSDYNEDDVEVFVIPLDDGAFALHWQDYYTSYIYMSVWEANGTVRQARTRIDGAEEPTNVPCQMPTAGGSYYGGMLPEWDAYNGYSFWYNTTDLAEEWSYESSLYGGDFMLHAKLPMWTDRIALLTPYSGTIRGSVITATDTYPVDDFVVVSGGYQLNSFMALPDNTFLMQATGTSDNGLNYWILDTDLSIISGPTAAFTALTGPASPSDPYSIKGAAV